MTTRRDFFKVMLAAGVATAVPALLADKLPVIYGDGIHDDTDGLQAAFDCKEFLCRNDCVRVFDGRMHLNGGLYVVSRTLIVRGDSDITLANAVFDVRPKTFLRHEDSGWALRGGNG